MTIKSSATEVDSPAWTEWGRKNDARSWSRGSEGSARSQRLTTTPLHHSSSFKQIMQEEKDRTRESILNCPPVERSSGSSHVIPGGQKHGTWLNFLQTQMLRVLHSERFDILISMVIVSNVLF